MHWPLVPCQATLPDTALVKIENQGTTSPTPDQGWENAVRLRVAARQKLVHNQGHGVVEHGDEHAETDANHPTNLCRRGRRRYVGALGL